MIHLILHGRLRKLAPDGLHLEVATAYEAVLAMSQVLAQDLMPNPSRPRQAIQILGYDIDQDLYVPFDPEVTELHIVPAFNGGKQAGMFQMIAGAVLIVVGIIVGICFSWTGVGATVAWYMIVMGAGMMMGGILAALSPAPKPLDMPAMPGAESGPGSSIYLGKPRNTTKIGTRIPVCYGVYKLFGQVLSADHQAVEVAV